MKHIQIISLLFLLIGCKNDKNSSKAKVVSNVTLSEELIVIEQDFNKALKIASKKNKLIFIDFYTTWCAPCKVLDKKVFKNDSIKQILKKDFILLKYNAENDSVFHLSKKYHISSYPTALILNKNGYLLNRQSGFLGENSKALQINVINFNDKTIALNEENKIVEGYSNKIDATLYPKFYADYVNRTNTNIDTAELNEYWKNYKDVFSEEYFSTLIYFASEASDFITDKTINNREKYAKIYGEKSVKRMVQLLIYGKFDRAIKEKNKTKFEAAVRYTEKAFDNDKLVKSIVSNSEIDFLKAQNKWNEVFKIYQKMKENGEMDTGYINHFSWQVYKDCDNQEVIKKCLRWMKEVTDKEPTYQYLDTYAYLMHKSGDLKETKRIANLAVESAKKENESSKSMKKLLSKL